MLSALVLTSILSATPAEVSSPLDGSLLDRSPLDGSLLDDRFRWRGSVRMLTGPSPGSQRPSTGVPEALSRPAGTDWYVFGRGIAGDSPDQVTIRGQGPGLSYDEDPSQNGGRVQSDLGAPQFYGGTAAPTTPWNPMAPIWPGNPMLAPNGTPGGPAPQMSVPGIHGPQPFRFGWTRRADVAFIPDEDIDDGPAKGEFGVFEFNTEFRYTAPLKNQWIFAVAPQYGLRTWDGPSNPDLPGSVHRLGLDLVLTSPTLGPFTAELGFNPSLNTDFEDAPGSDAWNWDGRGALLVRPTPQWLVVLGAMFWDRVDDLVLPYGGVVYTPNEWIEIRALFPRADVNFFLGTPWGIPQWLYVAGEYHVEAYEIDTTVSPQIELQDWRIVLGIRGETNGFTSFLEGGWVFDREIDFKQGTGDFDVSSGFIARFGIRF